MEQVVFIGIIVLFSILEAVVRKNRAKEGGELPSGDEGVSPSPDFGEVGEPPPGRSRRPRELPSRSRRPREVPPASQGEELSTYDKDASFDDAAPTSEGMIPSDVWEEIQKIARGGAATPRPAPPSPPKPAPSRVPAPEQRSPGRGGGRGYSQAESRPRASVPAPPVPVASTIQAPVRPTGGSEMVHAVHLTHPDYGKPVVGRLTGFAEDAPGPTHARVSVAWIRGGGVERLRQAVVLQELLGPPVSLRDEKSRRED